MIKSLAERLDNFPGAANQTRCFLHILNLTAKSILRQFDVLKRPNTSESDELEEELPATRSEVEDDIEDVDDVTGWNDDNEEGLEDVDKALTAEETAKLEKDLTPVRLMLTKVSRNNGN
jgi:hypothetical protein